VFGNEIKSLRLTTTVFPVAVVLILAPPKTLRTPAASVAVPASVGKLEAPAPVPVASRLIALALLVITTDPPVEVKFAHRGDAPVRWFQ